MPLTTERRTELEKRERSRRGRADAARRARVILLLADGDRYTSTTTKTECSSRTLALWRRHFESEGIAGLVARHRGSKRMVLTPALQARILASTHHAPAHGRRIGPRARSGANSASSTRSSLMHVVIPGRNRVGRSATRAPPICRCTRRSIPIPMKCSATRSRVTRRAIHIIVDNFGSRDAEGPDLSRRASDGALHLSAGGFVVAEPTGTVVFEDQARAHSSPGLYLGYRSPTHTDAVHRGIQHGCEAFSLVLCRPHEAYRMTAVQLNRRSTVAQYARDPDPAARLNLTHRPQASQGERQRSPVYRALRGFSWTRDQPVGRSELSCNSR